VIINGQPLQTIIPQIPPENLAVNKERLMRDLLELLDHLKIELDAFPRVRSWRDRLRERPSYKDAWPGEDDEE